MRCGAPERLSQLQREILQVIAQGEAEAAAAVPPETYGVGRVRAEIKKLRQRWVDNHYRNGPTANKYHYDGHSFSRAFRGILAKRLAVERKRGKRGLWGTRYLVLMLTDKGRSVLNAPRARDGH